MRAYPSLPLSIYTFSYNTTANSDTFWSLITYMHSQLPSLSDAGAMGYYFMTPNNSAIPDPAIQGQFSGVWLLPNKTLQQTRSLLSPSEHNLSTNALKWADPIHLSNTTFASTDYTKTWLALSPPGSVGAEVRLGSRLLDRKSLLQNQTLVTQLFRTANSQSPAITFLGHMVAGRNVARPPHGIPGGSNAVLPAWRRDIITHVVIPRTWPFLDNTAKLQTTSYLRNIEIPALKQIAPDTGAYLNEADPTEPMWQQTYWGENYPRLLSLKRYWDPEGVFWCVPCVGHLDGWEVAGDQGMEGGIGQAGGRVCRTG